MAPKSRQFSTLISQTWGNFSILKDNMFYWSRCVAEPQLCKHCDKHWRVFVRFAFFALKPKKLFLEHAGDSVIINAILQGHISGPLGDWLMLIQSSEGKIADYFVPVTFSVNLIYF